MSWEQIVNERLLNLKSQLSQLRSLFTMQRKDTVLVSAIPDLSDNVYASAIVGDYGNSVGFWLQTGVVIRVPSNRNMTLAVTFSVVLNIHNAAAYFTLTTVPFPEVFESVPYYMVVDREYPGSRTATPQYSSKTATVILNDVRAGSELYLQIYVRYSTYAPAAPQTCIVNNLNLSAKEM